MKFRPNLLKTSLLFWGSFLAILLLFWLFYIVDFTANIYLPTSPQHFWLIGLLLVFSIVFFVYTILRSYYTLEKRDLYQVRLTKKAQYPYAEIIYINEDWSLKHKTLQFVTNKGKTIYLMMDRKCQLLPELQKKCKNLLSAEEFKRKYPNIRL